MFLAVWRGSLASSCPLLATCKICYTKKVAKSFLETSRNKFYCKICWLLKSLKASCLCPKSHCCAHFTLRSPANFHEKHCCKLIFFLLFLPFPFDLILSSLFSTKTPHFHVISIFPSWKTHLIRSKLSPYLIESQKLMKKTIKNLIHFKFSIR